MNKKQEKIDIDLGQGIVLGGVFKGLGNLLDSIGKLAEKGQEFRREGEIKMGRDTKGIYGVTIKTGIGGESTVSSFGNIKKTPKGPVVTEEREPLLDIFDEREEVRIIAEVPGVKEDSIKTKIKGDILTLEAQDSDLLTGEAKYRPVPGEAGRKYYKEVVLAKNIDPGTLKTKYKNGVVEIRIKKR